MLAQRNVKFWRKNILIKNIEIVIIFFSYFIRIIGQNELVTNIKIRVPFQAFYRFKPKKPPSYPKIADISNIQWDNSIQWSRIISEYVSILFIYTFLYCIYYIYSSGLLLNNKILFPLPPFWKKSITVEPLLRGHPDERPPPLERPLDNVNLNINVLISTPDERPPLLKGHFSDAKGMASQEGFHCITLPLYNCIYCV